MICIFIIMVMQKTAGCEAVDGCFTCLAQEYSSIKFCRVLVTVLGTSNKFVSCCVVMIEIK